MENKEISAKRASSMRRNSFEQTLPSEVREILDSFIPRSDLERAAIASSAVPSLAFSKPSAAEPFTAPEPPAKEDFSGMIWGQDEMKSKEKTPPKAAAAYSQPAPVPVAPPPAPVPRPDPRYAERPAPTPVSKPVPPAPPVVTEPESSGKLPKIIAAIAAVLVLAGGAVIFMKLHKDKDQIKDNSSVISTAENSGEEEVTATTTTETAQPESTTTEETTTETETTTTEETTTETVTETEATTEASSSETSASTTPAPITYSVSVTNSVLFGEDPTLGYQWADPSNHSLGLSQVGARINFTRNGTDGSSEAGDATIIVRFGAVLTTNISGTGAFAKLDPNEQNALKVNIENMLYQLLMTPASDMKADSFRFGTDLVRNYWYQDYYSDWVRRAQDMTLTQMNNLLNGNIRPALS